MILASLSGARSKKIRCEVFLLLLSRYCQHVNKRLTLPKAGNITKMVKTNSVQYNMQHDLLFSASTNQ